MKRRSVEGRKQKHLNEGFVKQRSVGGRKQKQPNKRMGMIKEYIETGKDFGRAASFLCTIGKCVAFKKLLKKLVNCEKTIAECGYEPFDIDIFVDAGGYSKQIPKIKRTKKKEKPKLHAKFYSDIYYKTILKNQKIK